jgi:chaperone required for assembly of F1-ATPase
VITPIDPKASTESAASVPRPKRFYEKVSVAEEDGGHVVMLDHRRLKTPGRATLALADRALAEALAAEWEAQTETINAALMPLTRIANSAIDGVARQMDATRADIVAYAGNDLLCYRAESPAELAARQAELWDPLLGWAEREFGARLLTGEGIVPVRQPDEALARIGAALGSIEPLPLAALHVATTLTGSAIIAMAVAFGRLAPEEAWAAAHVDEDWQIAQWGEDAEARARREMRWRDMEAAALVLKTLQ